VVCDTVVGFDTQGASVLDEKCCIPITMASSLECAADNECCGDYLCINGECQEPVCWEDAHECNPETDCCTHDEAKCALKYFADSGDRAFVCCVESINDALCVSGGCCGVLECDVEAEVGYRCKNLVITMMNVCRCSCARMVFVRNHRQMNRRLNRLIDHRWNLLCVRRTHRPTNQLKTQRTDRPLRFPLRCQPISRPNLSAYQQRNLVSNRKATRNAVLRMMCAVIMVSATFHRKYVVSTLASIRAWIMVVVVQWFAILTLNVVAHQKANLVAIRTVIVVLVYRVSMMECARLYLTLWIQPCHPLFFPRPLLSMTPSIRPCLLQPQPRQHRRRLRRSNHLNHP